MNCRTTRRMKRYCTVLEIALLATDHKHRRIFMGVVATGQQWWWVLDLLVVRREKDRGRR